MEAGTTPEQARKAAAEARRQKILARQKDRLTSITGTYARPDEGAREEPDASARQPAAAAASSGATAGETQPTSQQQQQQTEMLQQQQQVLSALMAAVDSSLQRAQAASLAGEVGSQPQALGAIPSPAATSSADDPQQLLAALLPGMQPQQQPQQPQQESAAVLLLLKAGPAIAAAVERTKLVRLLSAVFLAYAALSGWLTAGLPPALLVPVTSLAVVAAAAVLLHGSGRLAADQQAQAQQELPRRLRGFDPVSLVPGLRGLLQALGGYYRLLVGLWDDIATYLVALVLLMEALQLRPAENWA